MIDRRNFLIGAAALAAACAEAPVIGNNGQAERTAPSPDFAPILVSLGADARLGVFAVDTGSGRTIGHDENGRFAMCSTFKAPLAGMVLQQVDAGRLRLADTRPVSRTDLVGHSPAVEAALGRERMMLEELCAATVQVSDNAAANLLLAQLGGPADFTAFMRRCGDTVTRLDRMEPEMNRVGVGDERDTTSAAAMAGLMRTLLLGDVLTSASRSRLIGWMEGATTGLQRLRAGLPAGWRAGDKTGTAGSYNNDVAIAWPPGRPPILIACYIDAPASDNAGRNAAQAAVARLVAAAFA
ncbi:class A beta-lactamase [Sphingosinicella sp.]|uniref:class A beta-lactamase n=1 Tax=Sphingosinicella sp. TaxID=1917971 RepID=UPI00403819F3